MTSRYERVESLMDTCRFESCLGYQDPGRVAGSNPARNIMSLVSRAKGVFLKLSQAEQARVLQALVMALPSKQAAHNG